MPQSLSEPLVDDVGSGEHSPDLLEVCDAILPLDHTPQVVRFSQFTLFTEPKPRGFGPVRLLVQEDDRGQVWTIYTDFSWIARRHGITDRQEAFAKASGVIASITSSVAAK